MKAKISKTSETNNKSVIHNILCIIRSRGIDLERLVARMSNERVARIHDGEPIGKSTEKEQTTAKKN